MLRNTLALLVVIVCSSAAIAEDTHEKTRAAFFRALKSKDPLQRAGAFELLRPHKDFAALRIGLEGVEQVRKDHAKFWERLPGKVAEFERARANHMEAKDRVASAKRRRLSSGRIRQFESAARRAASHRRNVGGRLTRARADARVARAQLTSAARVLGALLGRMGAVERRIALPVLRSEWVADGDPEGWLLWVDALVASDTKEAAADLLRLAGSGGSAPTRLQALALDGLLGLDPARATTLAVRHLGADLNTRWHLAATAIAVLREVRAKAGIPALIEFLRREGIARLRGDAHAALVALTHQTHGPYAGPWARWWRDAEATFVVPASAPKKAARGDASSTAFYGIHTFSDRMAFVMDLSWSMWNRTRDVRRIDTALKELQGAVGTLDAARRFAVVWFGSRADYWKPRMLPGSENEKRQLARWARDVDGKGQTNAYDGLELAFRFARRGEGRPEVDTLFFLTDGAPTAGPFNEAADILAEVRRWCRVERVRIHCVGVGEHDPRLLEAVAAASDGRYVRK